MYLVHHLAHLLHYVEEFIISYLVVCFLKGISIQTVVVLLQIWKMRRSRLHYCSNKEYFSLTVHALNDHDNIYFWQLLIFRFGILNGTVERWLSW